MSILCKWFGHKAISISPMFPHYCKRCRVDLKIDDNGKWVGDDEVFSEMFMEEMEDTKKINPHNHMNSGSRKAETHRLARGFNHIDLVLSDLPESPMKEQMKQDLRDRLMQRLNEEDDDESNYSRGQGL